MIHISNQFKPLSTEDDSKGTKDLSDAENIESKVARRILEMKQNSITMREVNL